MVTCLFPGQGAQSSKMLEPFAKDKSFAEKYAFISERLGYSPLDQPDVTAILNQNVVSSLLTVLTSILSFERWLLKNEPPKIVIGYSVGQWTALYTARVVNFTELVNILIQRSKLMDECFVKEPGAMLGCLGVRLSDLESLCESLRDQGLWVELSNLNCLGNYTLACLAKDRDQIRDRLQELKPRNCVEIPVNGAWHSSVLWPAAEKFYEFLSSKPLGKPNVTVLDNLTGHELPNDEKDLCRHLADHISSPVLWESCVKHAISLGCRNFEEIGHGHMLTKFGFFIDRSCGFKSFYF